MKVTADQLDMDGAELYLRKDNGMYRITAITSTVHEANEHMTTHASVLLAWHKCGRPGSPSHEELCLLADPKDVGIRSPEVIVRELVASIDYASPSEMKEAAEWLKGFAANMGHRGTARHIASELAPIIRKLGK